MEIKVIEKTAAHYEQMLSLRREILRKPLGLDFTPSDLEADSKDILIVAIENSVVIGCCILTNLGSGVLKLRQMAIDNAFQGKGIGKKILNFCEQIARENNHQTLILHARKTALNFYLKNNYLLVGEEFIEVGIPHFKMKKSLI